MAGIGPIGKNNLLITDALGPQVRLRALNTSAPLVCGEPILESNYCQGCDECIKACPARAFPDNEYNKDICLEYCEANKSEITQNTSIWCNVCLEVCPVGQMGK